MATRAGDSSRSTGHDTTVIVSNPPEFEVPVPTPVSAPGELPDSRAIARDLLRENLFDEEAKILENFNRYLLFGFNMWRGTAWGSFILATNEVPDAVDISRHDSNAHQYCREFQLVDLLTLKVVHTYTRSEKNWDVLFRRIQTEYKIADFTPLGLPGGAGDEYI